MARIRLIKRRIKTAQNISQITRAMGMVAASKMKRAQEQTQSLRPYAEKLYQISQSLSQKVDPRFHPFFKVKKGGMMLIFLVAPDKGLCGGLVTNLFRQLLNFWPPEKKPWEFLILGGKAKTLASKFGGEILAQFLMGTRPKYEMVPPIAKIITEAFLTDQYPEVVACYSHLRNPLIQEVRIKKLLPLVTEEKESLGFEYLFEPNARELLADLLPHYLETEIYQIILEAFASEQSARMMAMQAATENAQEIIAELTLVYNKERQQVVTLEIADIITAKIALQAHEQR